MPLAATELMIAYAYDTIHRCNPLGFFGMVLVLEGTSAALATNAAAALQRSLQLPDSALSYLRSHGSLDQTHLLQFETLMNRLETADDQDAVIPAASRFYRLYGDIYRALPLIPPTKNAA